MIKNRIFVVGCPRSGTTLLQGLLNTHPAITSFTESHFFDFGVKQPKSGPFYYVRKNANELIISFLSENSIDKTLNHKILNQMPAQPVIKGNGVTKWSQYFISILDTIATSREKNVWVEKTPDHLNRIKLISKVCPDAHFIHIIRNGKDVVASLFTASKKWKKKYTINDCVKFWNKAIIISTHYVNNKHHNCIFYDDLVQSPKKFINQLFSSFSLSTVNEIEKVYEKSVKSIVANEEEWKMKNLTSIKYSTTFKDVFTKDEQNNIEKAIDLYNYEKIKEYSY